jgi:hypothetical protein
VLRVMLEATRSVARSAKRAADCASPQRGKRNHEENETHFHLKTIIMTMRRTAVHPRRGGLKLYFSGLVTAYTTRRESMMTFTSHAAGPPRKALNHERPYSSARQHDVLSGGRIIHLLPADRSLKAGGRLGLRHLRKVDRVFAEGDRPRARGER